MNFSVSRVDQHRIAPSPTPRSATAPIDHSGLYLAAALTFTLVAIVGAVSLVASPHVVLGTVLLLVGDALAIIVWVDYLRRP